MRKWTKLWQQHIHAEKAGVNDPCSPDENPKQCSQRRKWFGRGINGAADSIGYKRMIYPSQQCANFRRTAPVGRVTTVKSLTVSRKNAWNTASVSRHKSNGIKKMSSVDDKSEQSGLYNSRINSTVRLNALCSMLICWWVPAVWALARSTQANILTRIPTVVSLRHQYKPTRSLNINVKSPVFTG